MKLLIPLNKSKMLKSVINILLYLKLAILIMPRDLSLGELRLLESERIGFKEKLIILFINSNNKEEECKS